jgi:hypothetical protein
MSSKGFIKSMVLAAAVAAPLAAHATYTTPIEPNVPAYGPHWDMELPTDLLSGKAYRNKQLEAGDYVFADMHKSGKGFFDEWSFTLADAADVTVSLFDVTLPGIGANFLYPEDDKPGKGHGHGYGWKEHKPTWTSLLDNKFLTVSLFDNEGTLLGTAGENGMLSALGLAAGQWYTLAVSGKAAGFFGGIYHGTLSIESASPVPIGGTLPLFASALMVFGLRSKKLRSALRIPG